MGKFAGFKGPSIDIGSLTRAGLFRRGFVRLNWSAEADSEPLEIRVSHERGSAEVGVTIGQSGAVLLRQTITLKVTTSGVAVTRSFICPQTYNPVNELLYVNGKLYSRHWLGIRYSSQGTRVRRSPILERNRAGNVSSSQFNTDAALNLGGRRALDFFDQWRDDFSRVDEYYAWTSLTGFEPWEEETRDCWEDHPRIDLAFLKRQGLVREGARTTLQLAYPEGAPVRLIRGFIELRPGRLAQAGFECSDGGRRIRQLVDLTCGPRPMFICPITGFEVKAVAFRGGRFASRKAQKLVNRSQL